MTRILVIDDDDTVRRLVRTVLESAGYDVMEAAHGEAGLGLHRERGADLVIVDIFMPQKDGIEVIRAIRAEVPGAKIIAMSGGGQTAHGDMLKVAAMLGAARTMRKPFEPRDLLAVVQGILGSAEHT